ncbi:MAG: hypothetical protein R3247_09565 [Rhodothermales bacterium]|nr:hypothetical protein [Rhodothermales bacterium]
MRSIPASIILFAVLTCFGCEDAPPTATEVPPGDEPAATVLDDDGDALTGAVIPFADAEVFFEFNATDNDLGLQLFLDAEGWDRIRVADPDRKRIIDFRATGPLSHLGITELRFESAEPSPAEVLALFPPGDYAFRGRTVGGDRLVGEGTLSHDLPTPPTFTPCDDDDVDPEDAEIEWSAPGAELVEIIVEEEDGDSVLDVIVPASTTSLDVPEQFLQPGTEYKIEILSIAANGNKTITECPIETAEDDDEDE